MVLETNMNEIVAQVEAQSKLEKAEVNGDAAALPRGRLMYSRLEGGGQPLGSGAGAYGLSPVSPVSACLSLRGGGWGHPSPAVLRAVQERREQPEHGNGCAYQG